MRTMTWMLCCMPLLACSTTQDLGKDQQGERIECDHTRCGPPLGQPSTTCADGSQGGPTGHCYASADGTCGWESRSCPDAGAGGGAGAGPGGDASTTTCKPSDCDGQPVDLVGCAQGEPHTVCQAGVDGKCHNQILCPSDVPCDRSACGAEPPVVPCIDGETHVDCSRYANGCGWNVYCGTKDAGSTRDGGSTDAAPSNLTWRVTCGDVVCRVEDAAVTSGPDTCTSTQIQGGSCDVKGQRCDAHLPCGIKLECGDHKLDTNCPISSGTHKKDVHYLTPSEIQSVAGALDRIKLTTYQYKEHALGQGEHLGFIIEDQPESSAVYPNHQQVDLYGYTSMAVAALQAQEQRIRHLEQEIQKLRRQAAGPSPKLGK